MSKLNFQSASGYDAWYNANYPKLRDYSIYSKGAAIWNAALAAPAVANGAAELPPLPECWSAGSYRHDFAVYTGDQMEAYARAAIAASTQQTVPKQSLTELEKMLIVGEAQAVTDDWAERLPYEPCIDEVRAHFFDLIAAKVAPNALLVAASRQVIAAFNDKHTSIAGVQRWVDELAAALASVPTAAEAT